MTRGPTMLVAARAVATHPRLWPTAARVAVTMAATGWWRRPPFLPVPSSDYVRFRTLTQYGDAAATPTTDDVLRYLSWCRDIR